MVALGCPVTWDWNATPDATTGLNMECHEALYWLVSYAIALEYEDVCAAASSSESLAVVSQSEDTMSPVGPIPSTPGDAMEEVPPDQDSRDDHMDINGDAGPDLNLTVAVDRLAGLVGLIRHTPPDEDDACKSKCTEVFVDIAM